MRRAAVLMCCLTLASGCGGDEEQPTPVAPARAAPPADPVVPAQVPAPPPSAGTTAGAPATPSAASEGNAGLPGAIQIEVLDQQLFHADSPRRMLRDPRDLENRTTERGSGFAFGFVIAARNDSAYLLAPPRILSDVRLQGTHGVAPCRVVARRSYWGMPQSTVTIVSPQRSDRTPWADESRNGLEAVWRPQETVRIRAVLECGPVHLHDIAPEHVTGSFQVVARAPFAPHEEECVREHEVCDDDVVGTSAPMAAPGHALSLAAAQIPGGPSGYVAGDIFIHADEGRARHESLAERGQSLFSVSLGELPPTPPPVRDSIDEWSMTFTSVEMHHWVDVPEAPKGARVVRVNATIAVEAASIEARLSAALGTARTEDQAARAALGTAQAAAAAAPDDPALSTALGDAERRASGAASALGRAESTYQRALGTERSRLARLVACDRVELVTHWRTLRSANARDVAASCSALTTGNQVQVTWTYVVGRYEVPLGVTYTAGTEPRTAFFAARSLATFDPR